MIKQIKLISFSILCLLMLIVVLQNTASVDTGILIWKFSMPQAALLFLTLAVGFSTGVLVANRLTARRAKKVDKTTES